MKIGLPSSNKGIQRKVHPQKWTLENIAHMKSEFKLMGIAYDWDREIATCLPEYYKWEQLLFQRFYKEGLAYKKTGQLNFCENCQTVLANEQVHEGKCWRCDNVVTLKEMQQWYLKITNYAKELLKDQAKKLYENLLAEGKVLYKERSPEPEIKRIKVTILESEIANTQDKNHKYNFKMLFGNYLSVSGIRLYLGKKGFFLSYPGGEWFSRGKSNYAFFPLFTVTQDCLRDRALEIVSGANKDKSALSH
jgi:DNA-directed RNA polymerase subunit M/transcription elongation factor TFIIS